MEVTIWGTVGYRFSYLSVDPETGVSSDKPQRMSLIERHAISFEALLRRDFASRFYGEGFLNGISTQKNATHHEMSKAGARTVLLASLLALFDLISGEIRIAGLTIGASRDLVPILSILTASSLLNVFMKAIDDQILFRILMKLGTNIGVHHFPLLLVDRMATNLWSDALTPRFFGERSGLSHKFAMAGLSLFMILLVLVMVAYPSFMIIRTFYVVVIESDFQWLSKAMATFALLLWLFSVLLMAVFVSKFTFHPPDFDEATGEPTEAFKKKMREQMAAEKHQGAAMQ